MSKRIEFARSEGLLWIDGQALGDNNEMLKMRAEPGFEVGRGSTLPEIKNVRLPLSGKAAG